MLVNEDYYLKVRQLVLGVNLQIVKFCILEAHRWCNHIKYLGCHFKCNRGEIDPLVF